MSTVITPLPAVPAQPTPVADDSPLLDPITDAANPFGLMATGIPATTPDRADQLTAAQLAGHECARPGCPCGGTDLAFADAEVDIDVNGRPLKACTRELPADDATITYQAASVYVANKVYDAALNTSRPAETLDDIADALPEVMPKAFQTMGTAPDLAAVLLPEVTDRIWAFTVVEYARAEAGDGYGYVFDLLVEWLRKGGDPHLVRTTALDVPARIRASAEQAGGDE